LTFEEAKSHFTAWALNKSPLLVRSLLFTIPIKHSFRGSRLAPTFVRLTFNPGFWLIFLRQLSAITPDILGILKNTEILAINQDPVVGQSISPFRWGLNVGTMA
jgi:alpha-galactosidase